jgi:hypothetical protein
MRVDNWSTICFSGPYQGNFFEDSQLRAHTSLLLLNKHTFKFLFRTSDMYKPRGSDQVGASRVNGAFGMAVALLVCQCFITSLANGE